MAYPKSPVTRILTRMKEIGEEAELEAAYDIEGRITFRHSRHRQSKQSERPCVALRLVSVSRDFEQGAAMSEVFWRAEIDIVVDLALPSEGIVQGADVTGWDKLTALANDVVNLYIKDDSQLRTLVDDVLPGDVDPDEDSKPDDGRLAQSVVVLYRTLWNDLNHLLSSEENGL